MYGPTVGDRVRLADTELIIEVEQDYTLRAGGYGEEVKFGGGKTIRDGMGQSQRINGPGAGRGGGLRHHQCADPRPLGHRQGRHRPARPAHLRHRQVRQPRRAAGRGHRHRPGHRGHRRRGHDRHRRRHRQPHPLHLPAADRRRAGRRRDHDARRRHRPGHRHAGHHLHARAGEHRAHAAGGRRLCHEHRLSRQGQRQPARGAAPADRGRRHRPEAARGLGHHALGDRLLPGRGRGDRHAGLDPQRHAQRIRLRRGHHRAPPRAARCAPSTPKAPAAATRRTSCAWSASRTSCPRPPTRPCPTP